MIWIQNPNIIWIKCQIVAKTASFFLAFITQRMRGKSRYFYKESLTHQQIVPESQEVDKF